MADRRGSGRRDVRGGLRSATLVVVALIALAGCGGAPVVVGSEGDGAPEGSWVLVAGHGPDGEVPLVDSHPITLEIDGTEGYGIAACNQYTATVAVSGDELTVADVVATEMACEPPAAMEAEAAYLAAFRQVNAYEQSDGRLVLTGEAVELTYRQQEEPEPAALVGTGWVLESLVSGAGPERTAASVLGEPDLLLRDDGTFEATTACRSLAGRWAQPAGESTSPIEFSEVAADGQGCPEELVEQDQHVLEVLDGEVQVEHGGRSLQLRDGELGLTYRAS